MNSLKQISPGLFGSEKALHSLAEKIEVKLLVISDSHGNSPLLKYIIKNYSKECDALVFAGDGACDLISIMEEAKTSKELKSALPSVIAFVRGNNDPYQYFIETSNSSLTEKRHEHRLFFQKNKAAFSSIPIPRETVFTAAGKSILVLHGHEQGVYYSDQALTEYAHKKNCQIAIHGHTHVPTEHVFSVYTMNPGSISLPRMMTKQGFAYTFIRPDVTYTRFFGLEDRKNMTFSPYNPETLMY